MVGIFSRFSSGRSGHRRTQSALDNRPVLPQHSGARGAAASAVTHGVEVALEFTPVDHPTEPLDNDQPVQCPVPEPSILNDGRIWKERVSAAGARRRSDMPLIKEASTADSEAGAAGANPRPHQPHRSILPSLSAPEHNILNMLEEYNASSN